MHRNEAVRRPVFEDLKNKDYEIQPHDPEFCIGIVERTLKHEQGETLDGRPLRGTPFELQPFQKFIIYNLTGIKNKKTGSPNMTRPLFLFREKTQRPRSQGASRGASASSTGKADP